MTRRLAALVLASLLAACAAQTTLYDVWFADGLKPGMYKKIMVIAVVPDEARRTSFEDALAKRIAGSVASHTLFTLGGLTDRAKVQAELKAQGFDGALVVRLIGIETTQSTMPDHATMLNPDTSSLYGYWDSTGHAWERDLVLTTRSIALETQFFDVASAERKFHARSSSYDPADQVALADELFDAIRAELKKRGLTNPTR